MSLCGSTLAELKPLLESGTVTATQVVSEHLQAIRQRDGQIGAFLGVNEAGALEAAAEVDQRRRSGQPVGPLAGIPVAVKDNLCVRGWKTTCASRMLENFSPPYSAHVVERLQNAGAILLGRTNQDEFAMGSSCENSAFAITRNPWNPDRTPGGSSGGSAAAVAAGFAPLALGTDTGGSIRQPAAFCGIVGLKPTYGSVSRFGLVAFASSLDQIGPFARTVTDAALLLDAISGHDSRDSTSVNRPATNTATSVEQPWSGLRIGVVADHLNDAVDPAVRDSFSAAIATYRDLGAEIHEVHLPHSRYSVAAYYVIAPCEASSNLARYDGVHYGHRSRSFNNLVGMYEASRGEGFGSEVKRRIMIGTYALSSGYYNAYYMKAMKVRRLIAEDYRRAFERVDVILTPSSPTPAFPIGKLCHDPLQMYLNDIYTIGANLAGIPGISLPCGFSPEGLPVGMQLLAPAFEEERLLRIARMYERVTDWTSRRPVMVEHSSSEA